MPEIFSGEKKDQGEEKKFKMRGSEVYHSLRKRGKEGGHFSSFAVVPERIKFETQEPEEKIILLLRQHPVVMFKWVLLSLVLIIVPAFWEVLPLDMLPANFRLLTWVLWYFLVLAFVLQKFLDWYFNVYIVTDERVVDIDFYGLIYRDLTVTKLNNIQDVNFTQSGGLAAMFNYGDVYIQTAAEKREFDFLCVPKPGRVVEILYQLLQEEEKEALEGRVR